MPFIWLTRVSAPESIRFLVSIAEAGNGHVADAALAALALHADEDAGVALEKLAATTQPEKLRRQAIFWLAQKAGQKIAESAIGDAIANDPETAVKKQAIFAPTQIPDGEGIPTRIQIARTNRNPEVRKQAVFWLGQSRLGQSRDPRALSFIEHVLK